MIDDKEILKHLGYIHNYISKYVRVMGDDHREDLLHEGILGLLHAKKKYDSNREVKFLTYASFWITAYVVNYVRKYDREASISIEDVTYFLSEKDESAEDRVVRTEDNLSVGHLLANSGLSKREKDILKARYNTGDAETMQSIGDRYKITRQRVEQIERKALAHLKKKYKKERSLHDEYE